MCVRYAGLFIVYGSTHNYSKPFFSFSQRVADLPWMVLFFDRKPASEKPWTDKLWIYDFRTNKHFTLKTNTLRFEDLHDFIKCYHPENRFKREESERFRMFTYDELMQRDKVSLDIFWLKDESLEDSEHLPDPDILAKDIADNLESALEQFNSIYEDVERE